jgi:Sec-independent protein translocase protein TatA
MLEKVSGLARSLASSLRQFRISMSKSETSHFERAADGNLKLQQLAQAENRLLF